MGLLVWLEQTALATFIRESSSLLGFPTFLFLHTIGLSLVLGASTIISMRILGLVSSIPLQPLKRLFPFIWVGFVLTLISGIGLAIADATNKLVNPLLLVKLVLIALATACMWLLDKRVFSGPAAVKGAEGEGRVLAGALLVLWLAATILGRLIAYSRTIFDL